MSLGPRTNDNDKASMENLLQNPAVQAGVLPFAAALACSAALLRTRLLALAQLAGFLVLVAFAIGFSFESLTATRKLVLIGMATGLAVLVMERRAGGPGRKELAALLATLGAAALWMVWRLLAQMDAGPALLAAAMAMGYVVVLVGLTVHVAADPVRGSAAGLMVGLGTGALAILGASAVLGTVAIAVGASAGATLLVQMLRGRSAQAGATISLPASAIAGLAGVLAVMSASLPWFCLVPVLAAPLACRLVPQRVAPLWLRALLSALAALLPMLVAIALAWSQAGRA